MSVQKTDVSVALAQDFNDTQKKQARANIGSNRVVFVTYGTSTQDEISAAINAGDSVILQVPATGSATYVPLSYASSGGYVFRSPASSTGAFAEYSVSGSTWTSVHKNVFNTFTATAEIAYNDTADTTLATIGGIVISCKIQNEAFVQLKLTSSSSRFVTTFSETLNAGDNASVNNYPSQYSFSSPTASVYTGFLYNANAISFQETRFCLEDGSLTTLRVTCVFVNSTYKFHFQLF